MLSLLLPLAQPLQAVADTSSNTAPPSQSAIQNGTYVWHDRETIDATIGGQTYYFKNSYGDVSSDTNVDYVVKNSACYGVISFSDSTAGSITFPGDSSNGAGPKQVAPKSINIDMDFIDPSSTSSSCQNTSPNTIKNITLGEQSNSPNNYENYNVFFYVSGDGRHILPIDGDSNHAYTQSGTYANLFTRDSENGQDCQDVIWVDANRGIYQSFEIDKNGSGPPPPASIHAPSDCKLIGSYGTSSTDGYVQMGVDQYLGNAGVLKSDPNPDPSGGITAAPAGGGQVSCNLGITGSVGGILNAINPLNYILCGMLIGADHIVTGLDNEINNFLSLGTDSTTTDNPNQIFADSHGCSSKVKAPPGASSICDDYQTAWSSFRDLALGLLVIAGLIAVIAQALGMEILDAYTVRKMLPRLLIVTLAITLSWQLMRFAVILSNDLGYAIGTLIYGPFHSLGVSFNTGNANNLLASLAASLAALLLDFFGLLAFVATAALAVIITIIVLVLRQIVIILLMIISPIAIVCYIMPNTQRYFKFWWESFSRALLMFPLIVAFIAVGHVFASISSNTSGNFIYQVAAFIAYFGPYFAIPLTFRFAGSIMGGIGNAVNSRGEGMRRSLANVRSARAKKNMENYREKFKTGGFGTIMPAREKGLLGKMYRANRAAVHGRFGVNALSRRASAGIMRGGLGFGARGESALEASLMEGAEAAGKEHGMQENATINAFNRLMVFMARRNGNEAEAMDDLRNWYSSDKNEYNREFQGHELEEKLNDARGRVRNVGGYTPARAVASYLAMGRDGTAIRDVRDSGEIAAWVSEGSATTAYNLLSQVASDSKRGGRSELSPSQEHKAALVGATVRAHKKLPVPDLDKIIDGATMSGAGSETGLSILSGSPSRVIRGNVEHAMDILKRYEKDDTSVPFEDAAQAASVVLDLQNNVEMGYGKPDNKITFNNAMAVEGRKELLNKFLQKEDPRNSMSQNEPRKVMDEFGNEVTVINPRKPVVDDYGKVVTATKVGDYVKKLVGNRYTQMPHELEERIMADEMQRRQPPQNNPQ